MSKIFLEQVSLKGSKNPTSINRLVTAVQRAHASANKVVEIRCKKKVISRISWSGYIFEFQELTIKPRGLRPLSRLLLVLEC